MVNRIDHNMNDLTLEAGSIGSTDSDSDDVFGHMLFDIQMYLKKRVVYGLKIHEPVRSTNDSNRSPPNPVQDPRGSESATPDLQAVLRGTGTGHFGTRTQFDVIGQVVETLGEKSVEQLHILIRHTLQDCKRMLVVAVPPSEVKAIQDILQQEINCARKQGANTSQWQVIDAPPKPRERLREPATIVILCNKHPSESMM